MLFILDHCVDRVVAGMLRGRGHRCHTAGEVGLATADDNTLAVYADDKGAIFVSHDAEAAQRRRENTFGRHVHLKCLQPFAVQVLEEHLDEVIELAMSRDSIVIKVTTEGVHPYPRSWT